MVAGYTAGTMALTSLTTIVAGGLNTDILGLKVNRILGKGELTMGGQLQISAGGKSRNIAQMIAALSPASTVAMIGKTSKDPYQLWKAPIDALEKAGVNTNYIQTVSFEESGKYPGIALIPVDTEGNNQIYVLPGINDDFSIDDIDAAEAAFDAAAQNNGMLALSLECPFETVLHALKLANKKELRTMLDPGGILEERNYDSILAEGLFLIKPNAHEARMLTGYEVTGFASARRAAKSLLKRGVQNVLITLGKEGAYFFDGTSEEHLPIPAVPDNGVRDETGCGDQTMAAFCAAIQKGKPAKEAASIAIYAGTLQFHRYGIQPVTSEDLMSLF